MKSLNSFEIVCSGIKKIDKKYCIVTVKKNLLLEFWTIEIYSVNS